FSFPFPLNNGNIPSLKPIWIPSNFSPGYQTFSQIGMDFSVNISVIILNYIVVPLFSIFLILSAFSYIVKHNFFGIEKFREYIPRIFAGIILSYSSIYIADIIFYIGRTFYSFIYSGLNIQWSGIPSPYQGLISLQYWPWNYFVNFSFSIYASNGFLEFLILIALLSSMLIFTLILVTRLIWIYFLIIILPIGSLLLILPKTENLGKNIWLSFIDKTFEIFFIGLVLLFLGLIQDPIFWTSIFIVASLVPRFMSISGKITTNVHYKGYIPTIITGEKIFGSSKNFIANSTQLKLLPKMGGK
ncbi:MAG: hypothetical protein QXV56_05895, partial [Thermoplasmata archaeon]